MVLKALADYKTVINNVCNFYFEDCAIESLESVEKLVYISNLIKNSHYNGEIKSMLYAFFIEPISFIQKLIHELIAKDVIMAEEYKRRQSEVINLQKNFDYEELIKGLIQIDKHPLDITNSQNVCISFLLNNQNYLWWINVDETDFFILGSDYMSSIQRLTEVEIEVKLDVFGNVVSEINRVDILNFILKNGEVNIKDIERELKFTGANAYYHLTLMLKSGLLKSRNQGRMILYSINDKYFNKLCDMLVTFCGEQRQLGIEHGLFVLSLGCQEGITLDEFVGTKLTGLEQRACQVSPNAPAAVLTAQRRCQICGGITGHPRQADAREIAGDSHTDVGIGSTQLLFCRANIRTTGNHICRDTGGHAAGLGKAAHAAATLNGPGHATGKYGERVFHGGNLALQIGNLSLCG